jgi:uncharacterized membrane protein
MTESENYEQNKESTTTARVDPLRAVPSLAATGLALSALLSFLHVRTHLSPNVEAFCSVGELFDCASVAASSTSIFLGAPWAFWGVLGFGTLLYLSLSRSIWLFPLSVGAAATSLALLLVSLLKVGSLCYLCEGVHLVSWAMCFLVVRGRGILRGKLSDLNHATSVVAAPLGLAVGVALFTPAYWGSFNYRGEPPFPTGVTEDGLPWIGSETPTLTLHEFTDYNCPHCKARSALMLRRLKQHSDWRLIRRQQPRMRCAVGLEVACQPVRLAFCAQDQGKFWRADRWLFTHLEPGKPGDVQKMAADLDLDLERLQACVNSDETYRRAEAAATVARKAKIQDVPGYLIDGKRYRLHELEEFLKNRPN